jgi:hypothetical protein
MISLNDTWDSILMILAAAGVGAFAGLGAYALQSRAAAEADKKLSAPASMLVGGLASVGILYFVSPVVHTSITLPQGSVKETSQYDLLKLVSLAAIVGSAGRAVLTSLQSRVGAAVSEKTSANMVAEAPKAAEAASGKIQADVDKAQSKLDSLASELQVLAKAPDAPVPVKQAATKVAAAQNEIGNVGTQAESHLLEVAARIDAAAGGATSPGDDVVAEPAVEQAATAAPRAPRRAPRRRS